MESSKLGKGKRGASLGKTEFATGKGQRRYGGRGSEG